MADKLISALPAATTAASTDALVLNQDAGGGAYQTRQITVSDFQSSLSNNLPVLTANGSTTTLGSSAGLSIVSLSVPAGRWRIRGRVHLWGSSSSSTVGLITKLGTVQNDVASAPSSEGYAQIPASRGTALAWCMAEVTQATATTWYLSAETVGGPTGGETAYAGIVAERLS